MRLDHHQPRWFLSLQRLAGWHQRSLAYLPRWRHPLVGYPVGLLLVGLSLAVSLVEARLLFPFSFPGLLLLFVVVLVALCWGVGAALFTTALSVLALDYLYVPPFGNLGSYGWNGLVQLVTFAAVGIVVAVLTQQHEIARVRALEARQEAVLQMRQLEATFEAISDGVVVYDRKGQVQQVNHATWSLFGITALPVQQQEREGHSLLLSATQHDEQGQPAPEKRQLLGRLFRGEHLTGAKAVDVLVQTPDGRAAIFNASGAPIRNASGKIEYAVLIYRDVTGRRRLERRTNDALRALLAVAQTLVQAPAQPHDISGSTSTTLSEQIGQRFIELATQVVESQHATMLTVDPQEDRLSLVAATGFTPQQQQEWHERLASSPSLIDHIGNEQLVASLKRDEALLLDGMSLPLYTPVLPYYVQAVLVVPICVGDRLLGLLCLDDGSREHSYSSRDIVLAQTLARLTSLLLARIQLQQQNAEAHASEVALRETNRLMEAYPGIICHELKTPLTVIRGSLQLADRKVKRLMATELPEPGDLRHFASIQALLERARAQVAVQDRLINDLLDISRIQAQALTLLMARCNVADVVLEAVEDQRQVASEHTIHLELPAERDIIVLGDADRLAQVVTNFLINALKYSPPDRPITVCVRIEHEQARVLVRDEGPGLPPEEHERVWERFYRVPGISEQGGFGGGLGLGLYVCRTIIEQHGGRVGLQSMPGDGATFWFALPLAQQGDIGES
jgi:PAS domain S-box-containing protein